MESIREKIKKIDDDEILNFVWDNVSRSHFLTNKGVASGGPVQTQMTIETVVDFGFTLRDRLSNHLMSEDFKEEPCVVEVDYVASCVFDDFPTLDYKEKLKTLFNPAMKHHAKFWFTVALYFLKHYNGHVGEKTIFVY